MTLKTNLVRLRRSAQLSQPQLAKKAGVSQQLISRLENGIDLTTKKLPEIARALGVSVFEIDSNFAPDDAAVSAPLISWVSAGAIKKPEHVEQFDEAPRVSAPGLDPKGEWIALKVDGDSMDRISPPESIIFVNLRDRRLVPNACYVISDEEGGSAYRRYRTNPLRWEPVSQNPVHEAHFIDDDKAPRVIGRVKKTVLDM